MIMVRMTGFDRIGSQSGFLATYLPSSDAVQAVLELALERLKVSQSEADQILAKQVPADHNAKKKVNQFRQCCLGCIEGQTLYKKT